MGFLDLISELQIELAKIRTLATVYSGKFVDQREVADRMRAVELEPETQVMLFAVLEDAIASAIKMVEGVEA